MVGLVGPAQNSAWAFDAYKCRVKSCASGDGQCAVEQIIDPGTVIEVTNDSDDSAHITLCSPTEGKIGLARACDELQVDKIEVRALCHMRGHKPFKKGEEGYCGEHQKFYSHYKLEDLQINTETNRFLYNTGSGVILFGSCENVK